LIAQVTGSARADWIARHIVAPADWRETVPDMPLLPRGMPMAKGHSAGLPFGRRTVVPGDNGCDGMAWPWVGAIGSILWAFKEHGAPTARVAPWRAAGSSASAATTTSTPAATKAARP
jgi:hypothetical protein